MQPTKKIYPSSPSVFFCRTKDLCISRGFKLNTVRPFHRQFHVVSYRHVRVYQIWKWKGKATEAAGYRATIGSWICMERYVRPHAVSQPHLDLEKPTAWHATRSIHRYDDGYGGKTEAYDIKYFDLNTSNMMACDVLYNQCILIADMKTRNVKALFTTSTSSNTGANYCRIAIITVAHQKNKT